MTIYETIHQMLQAHGITTEYTNQQIDSLIFEAKLLINTDYMNPTIQKETDNKFRGGIYATKEYPILTDTISIRINNNTITPEHVTPDGLVYFDKEYRGRLICEYTRGLPEEDINNYLVPVVVCMIEEKEGHNISSITEGDVSVSYANGTGYTSTTLDALITQLKNKYGARVRLI